MTAIILLVCHSVRELVDLSDALWQNAFNIEQSLNYYRIKRRLQLFRFHCRELWLRQSLNNSGTMHRRPDIDFAAIEAGAECIQNIDTFDCSTRELHERFQQSEGRHLMPLDLDIEVVDGKECQASFYEYPDAVPKYFNDQIGQLSEGISFTVTGNLAVNCERFSINLVHNNVTRDVALHINPRLPQNYIVRNTKVQDIWGSEEVSSALPFLLTRGDKFSIQVLVTDACYMISVNGQHFAAYKHRIPYRDVSILEVKGDVSNVEMQRTLVLTYPQRLPESEAKNIELHIDDEIDEIDASVEETVKIPHEWCLINAPITQSDGSPKSTHSSNDFGLTLPYYGALPPNSLVEGRCLKIEGRVRLLPHSFYINLQKGQDIWPHPVVAFHLNPRFSKASSGALGKAVVCRNAWLNGAWAEEERSEFDTNFRPGRTFSLVIVCTKDAYEVYVNRQFMTDFKYKVSPALVDTVYIQGDVKLWNVTLEQNPLIKGKNVRVYHNPLYTDEY
ncbi:galectin-4 isoform X1 [Drosophila takahashii]|uniref:galectin-4 isoform X1 n=1 Tax=Drosophila takahashii TaxID=29030 RepID=UPI0007E6894F|nr:galectin-9 isoform X1 [Drosophila takahashii]XP_044250749.1 galectin-9 isoform X1 [Drosophila takahashii]